MKPIKYFNFFFDFYIFYYNYTFNSYLPQSIYCVLSCCVTKSYKNFNCTVLSVYLILGTLSFLNRTLNYKKKISKEGNVSIIGQR